MAPSGRSGGTDAREAARLLEQSGHAGSRKWQSARMALVHTLGRSGQRDAAAKIARETFRVIDREGTAVDWPTRNAARANLAAVLDSIGASHEAIEHFDVVYQERLDRLGPTHSGTLSTGGAYAVALNAAGRTQEAADMMQTVADGLSHLAGPGSAQALVARANLLALKLAARPADVQRAEAQALINDLRASDDVSPIIYAIGCVSYAQLLAEAGRGEEAVSVANEGLERLRDAGIDDHGVIAELKALAGATPREAPR